MPIFVLNSLSFCHLISLLQQNLNRHILLEVHEMNVNLVQHDWIRRSINVYVAKKDDFCTCHIIPTIIYWWGVGEVYCFWLSLVCLYEYNSVIFYLPINTGNCWCIIRHHLVFSRRAVGNVWIFLKEKSFSLFLTKMSIFISLAFMIVTVCPPSNIFW